MTIGFYDIDLWHRGKAAPNLELMKMYNYHLKNNDIPIMMKPNEDEGRFSKIIYFKDNPNITIPKTLSLYGENKEIYGYGFFNKFYPLEEKYCDVPPSYFPYDPYTRKISVKNYDLMKTSSYIRLENKDFSDFKKDRTHIFIADRNFCYLKDSADFLQEYKNYRFDFIHRLEIKDNETFRKIIPYSSLINRRLFINYKISGDLFKQYYDDRIIFDWINPFEGETKEKQIARIISMILYYKITNTPVLMEYIDSKDPFLKNILIWGISKNQKSCYDFYIDNKRILKTIEAAPSQIRLLLKSNPKKLKQSDINFNGLLSN